MMKREVRCNTSVFVELHRRKLSVFHLMISSTRLLSLSSSDGGLWVGGYVWLCIVGIKDAIQAMSRDDILLTRHIQYK